MDGESLLIALRDGHFEWQGIAFYGNHNLNHDQEGFNQWTPFREENKRNIIVENQFFAVRDSRYKLTNGDLLLSLIVYPAVRLCFSAPGRAHIKKP